MPDVRISDITQPTMLSTVAVFFLDHPSLSEVVLSIGSRKPSAEVIPAKSIARNSRGARILPIGPIILNIIGKTMNMRPVPSVMS